MAHHEVVRSDGVHVLSEMCPTCVFRPGNLMCLNPGCLKGMIEEARANESCIPCHSTIHGADVKPAVCRGYFDRYATIVWTLRFAIAQGWIVFDDPPTDY